MHFYIFESKRFDEFLHLNSGFWLDTVQISASNYFLFAYEAPRFFLQEGIHLCKKNYETYMADKSDYLFASNYFDVNCHRHHYLDEGQGGTILFVRNSFKELPKSVTSRL